MKKKVMIFLVDWLLYENEKEEDIHYGQFLWSFYSQAKAVWDSKIKGHTIDFGQKNKGQIRDRTSKNLEYWVTITIGEMVPGF